MKFLKELLGKKSGQNAATSLDSPDDLYQAIASELSQTIREPWMRVDVEAKRHESSINIKVIYIRPDGSAGSVVDFVYLSKYFFDLAEMVSTKNKGLYKVCNFTLSRNGDLGVDFQY